MHGGAGRNSKYFVAGAPPRQTDRQHLDKPDQGRRDADAVKDIRPCRRRPLVRTEENRTSDLCCNSCPSHSSRFWRRFRFQITLQSFWNIPFHQLFSYLLQYFIVICVRIIFYLLIRPLGQLITSGPRYVAADPPCSLLLLFYTSFCTFIVCFVVPSIWGITDKKCKIYITRRIKLLIDEKLIILWQGGSTIRLFRWHKLNTAFNQPL